MKTSLLFFTFFITTTFGFPRPAFFPSDKGSYSNYRQNWKKDENSDYNNYENFKKNIDYINQHNSNNSSNYILKVNDFTDQSEEFLQTTYFNQEFPNSKKMNLGFERLSMSSLTSNHNTNVDWRKKNVVTPVKNQGACGSCWAFSAVGALEAKVALKTGELHNLSNQMVVDCSSSNYACQGGFMHTAFEDILDMDGLCKEEDYPYFAGRGRCNLEMPRVKGSSLFGHDFILPENMDALKKAVNKRPISIALAGDSRDFLFYGGGVLDNIYLPTRLNHAVLLVGYDEKATVPYWIIKNSWGKKWGEDGYIRVKMIDGKGIVGMNQYGVYPF